MLWKAEWDGMLYLSYMSLSWWIRLGKSDASNVSFPFARVNALLTWQCVKCGSPQSTSQSNRRHEHPLVPVTANGVISQSHLTYLTAAAGNRKCDGCSAEPAKGFILSCNTCGFTCNSCRKEGFNLVRELVRSLAT